MLELRFTNLVRRCIRNRGVRLALWMIVAPLVSGCWSVQPPANVRDPVPVFLADYGNHSAVLLPQSPEVYVEYSFGDYAYAVHNIDTPLNGLAALTISLQSALGRSWTPMDQGADAPRTVRTPDRMVRIVVERGRALATVAKMDARYRKGLGVSAYNVENDGYFVKDCQHYSVFNNCNHLSAWLLRDMGCEVSGITILSTFRISPVPTTQPVK